MKAAPLQMSRPNIGEAEIEAVVEVLRSGTLALGPRAAELEVAVARLAGRRHGVACSSGTAGLHLAVRALEIGDGDEVLTTPFSFVASANCLLYERARPVFVDIEEDTLGIDPALAEAAWGPRTVGLLPVHVFGQPCQIGALTELAVRRRGRLIEDACEALGCSLDGRALGSFGDLSVFAFYPNKQITTGEGGVVVTDDPELAELLVSLRNQGRDADGTWLRHVRVGYNYRLDEMSAALGVVQIARLAELRAARDRVAKAYATELADLPWLRLPVAAPDSSVDWFVYVVRVDPSIKRDRLIAELAEQGIPSRPYFTPLHLQAPYRELGHRAGDFPVCERVASETLALPFSTKLTEDDVARVAAALRRADRAKDGAADTGSRQQG